MTVAVQFPTELPNRPTVAAPSNDATHSQFHGCDRHWTWCDIHHLVENHHDGFDTWTTSRCCVKDTTRRCTKAAGNSIVDLTAN